MPVQRSRSIRLSLTIHVLLLTLVFPSAAFTANPPPLVIGAIYALTGEAAVANQSSIIGIQLAIEEINRDGGVLGRKVQLLLFDNMSTPIGSHSAAREAVKAGVIAIIGAQWSSHSLAIARVAQKNGIPMLSNYSTNPKLTLIGENIFRICFSDEHQGRVMANFAYTELKARRAVVVVNLNSDYSLGIAKIFNNNFSLAGGTIKELEYKTKTVNYNELARQILQVDADVIFLAGHDESGNIAGKLESQGVSVPLMGGDSWSDNSFLLNGGNKVTNGYFCTHWHPLSDQVASIQFTEQYQRRKGFGVGAALSYDATRILLDAIKRAGSPLHRDIRNALQQTTDFQGVTGTISFDAHGDPLKDVLIMKLENGRVTHFKTYTPGEIEEFSIQKSKKSKN